MVTINLYDYNFGQSETAYSVAYQLPEHVHYVRNEPEWGGITLFTDEFINNPVVDRVKSKYKVGWLHEPECLHPQTYRNAVLNRDKFDFIMTYDDHLISAYPDNFCYSPYGGVWIARQDWGLHPKPKLCSMLFGAKFSTDGHKIRHYIYDAVTLQPEHIVDFYGVRGEPTDYSQNTKLRVLKDYKFSIVVETCRQNGLFTEILLDAIAVGTIPIFWGAPDVGNFFDDRGIISFETVDDLLEITDILSDKLYNNLRPYAEVNLEMVAEYRATEDWQYEHYYKDMT